jgi:hypothetical protein
MYYAIIIHIKTLSELPGLPYGPPRFTVKKNIINSVYRVIQKEMSVQCVGLSDVYC